MEKREKGDNRRAEARFCGEGSVHKVYFGRYLFQAAIINISAGGCMTKTVGVAYPELAPGWEMFLTFNFNGLQASNVRAERLETFYDERVGSYLDRFRFLPTRAQRELLEKSVPPVSPEATLEDERRQSARYEVGGTIDMVSFKREAEVPIIDLSLGGMLCSPVGVPFASLLGTWQCFMSYTWNGVGVGLTKVEWRGNRFLPDHGLFADRFRQELSEDDAARLNDVVAQGEGGLDDMYQHDDDLFEEIRRNDEVEHEKGGENGEDDGQ
jgi:hypothetical protein